MRLIRTLPSGCRSNRFVSLHISPPPQTRRTPCPASHCFPLVDDGVQSVTCAAAGKTKNDNTINSAVRAIVSPSFDAVVDRVSGAPVYD